MPSPSEEFDVMKFLTFKRIATIVVVVITLSVVIAFYRGLTGKNDMQSYQVWQGVRGDVRVIDEPGYYWNWFGTAWTYQKSIQCYWSASPKEGNPEDESVRVTFNDGGNAQISAMVQFSMPLEEPRRRALHAIFGGNIENIKHAVHAHLVNCIKNTGPLMSASENQASRKSEFAQVVEDQLRKGLYEMRRTTVALKDRLDEKGQPIKVEATEIVRDGNGVAIQAEVSPLAGYGLEIVQFSITGTDYDKKTIEQFAAKQDAFLAAERSKAEREQEIQKKLMIEAQGLRQVAEIEAAANMVKAKAITEGQQRVDVAQKEKEAASTQAQQAKEVAEIQAQQKVTVALKDKEAAETAAKQKLAVAEIEKQSVETKAKQEAEVARIGAEMQLKVAEFEANANAKRAEGLIKLAEAKQKEIDIGGAVKEHDRILAEIARDRDIKVSENLGKIQVPQNITILGGAGGGGASNGQTMVEMMIGLSLMKNMGLIKESTPPAPAK